MAHRKRKEREIHLSRQLNFELAQMMAFAFHDPQNIPEPVKASETGEVSLQEGAKRMRKALLGLVDSGERKIKRRKS